MMNVEAVLARLQGVRRNGTGWKALCPAHADKNPSLSINELNGKVLVHCHAGCQQVDVWNAIERLSGVQPNSEPPRELSTDNKPQPREVGHYDYTDEKGALLYQVVRYEPKNFKQRRPDGKGGWIWNLNGTRRVLYRLPEVLAGKSVLVCEGEKDCDTARALGLVATCNAGGACKFAEGYSEPLRGKRITIIADADEPGRKHAQQVAASLYGKAESVKVLELPGAKDLSEWKGKYNFSRDALLDLICKASEWKPTAQIPGSQAGAVLRRASDIVERKLCWLWPGRIPLGKFTLFAGDPDLGKSAVTIDIAARVTRGTAWPDDATNDQAGSVIILTAEDDPEDTVKPRLRVAGADLDKVYILQAVRHSKPNGDTIVDYFSLQTDVVHLQDAVVLLGDVRLVIVDPISAYLGNTDSHVNARVRGILAPLTQVAQVLRFSVIGLDHLSKSNRSALYRPNGSIAFVAAARALWFFAKNPDDENQRLMLPGKMNLARTPTGLSYTLREGEPDIVTVVWGKAVSIPTDLALTPEQVEQRSERVEATGWLADLLADGPVAVKRIQTEARAAGLSWATVRRAKEALSVIASKAGYQGAWQWELEDAHSKDAHPIDTQMSTFERATENKELNGSPTPQVLTMRNMSIFDSMSTFDEASGDDDEVQI